MFLFWGSCFGCYGCFGCFGCFGFCSDTNSVSNEVGKGSLTLNSHFCTQRCSRLKARYCCRWYRCVWLFLFFLIASKNRHGEANQPPPSLIFCLEKFRLLVREQASVAFADFWSICPHNRKSFLRGSLNQRKNNLSFFFYFQHQKKNGNPGKLSSSRGLPFLAL